jgi:sugar/nucleoside kinase (ribokinase family)
MQSVQNLKKTCADRLLAAVEKAETLTAFVGIDGFVDEIIHIVDVRENAGTYTRLPTITSLSERIAAASGKSTNLEAVTQRVKLGGNGPIMANALTQFGLKVTYLGALGYPNLHPVFADFAKRADVHTIAPPGLTDALEFEDGKVMLGKLSQLSEVTWPNIQKRFGQKAFAGHFFGSNLVAFVNWTMIPFMSDIWESVQTELGSSANGVRRTMFVDLADPEKRTPEDIIRALKLIGNFQKNFDVILGLNEKETYEIAGVLEIDTTNRDRKGVINIAQQIAEKVAVKTLVVHPVTFAFACTGGKVVDVDGPYITKPLITTGAGDHFNAGFCLGKLLGLEDELAVLVGVTTSGFYVRNAASPTIQDLASMLGNWPTKDQ